MTRPLLLLLLCTASVAAAQQPHQPFRKGFWMEFVAGVGNIRVGCSACSDVVSENGFANNFRIGGTISDHVAIGFESFNVLDKTFGLTPDDPNTVAETHTGGLVVLWYPGNSGLFFKGGVGTAYGQFSVPTGAAQADTAKGEGIGLTFGAGWDWAIHRRVALTLNLGAYVTAVGDIVLPTRRVDDVIATMYELGVGFTIR